MRRISLLVVCTAWLCAGSVHASTLEVRFELTGQLGFLSGATFTPLPADTNFSTGILRLAYPTSATGPVSSMGGSLAPLPGAVALRGGRFSAQATVLVGHVPGSMAVAGQRITLQFDLASALGTLHPSGTLLLPQIHAQGSGMRTCAGGLPYCDPATAFVPQAFVIDPFTFLWNAPSHLDGTSLRAAALVPKTILLDAPIAIRFVTATEIDRHLVPEPGSLPLASGGLAALALLAARRRRARR